MQSKLHPEIPHCHMMCKRAENLVSDVLKGAESQYERKMFADIVLELMQVNNVGVNTQLTITSITLVSFFWKISDPFFVLSWFWSLLIEVDYNFD